MSVVASRRAPGARSATPDRAELEVRSVHLHDPLVRPLLDELSHEYWTRYRRVLTEQELREEMEHYPAEDFAAPHGELVLLLADGEPVAGGAFRRRTEPELGERTLLASSDARRDDDTPAVPTAELKRIWTHSAHRRRGHSRTVLDELERRAAARGYLRLYLTTGPRQPEAVGMYLAAGYSPLFDTGADPEEIGPHAFEKWLVTAP